MRDRQARAGEPRTRSEASVGSGSWLRSRCVLVAMLPTLLATSCPHDASVWIEPGSTATQLVFRTGNAKRTRPLSEQPYGFEVVLDGSWTSTSTFWEVRRNADSTSIDRVTYGVTPSGYRVEVRPKPLGPGRYRATVIGYGLDVAFTVDQSGAVTEIPARAAEGTPGNGR